MAESNGGIFEMLWDCGFCDTKQLLGKTNRYCPSCGAPQDETKRYFPPPGKEKEVVANTTFDGVDVKCPACGTPNGAKANNCKHCGSPLNEAAAVKQLAERDNRPVLSGVEGPRADDVKLLNELGQAMRDASICGLGQTASTAIESALKKFPAGKSP